MKSYLPSEFARQILPFRFAEESFEKYKSRQKWMNSILRKHRQGILKHQQLWISRDLVSGRTATYVRKKHGAL